MWVAFSMDGHPLLGTWYLSNRTWAWGTQEYAWVLAGMFGLSHRHAYLFNATELDASTELAIFEPRVSLTKFYPIKTVLFMQCAPCNSDTSVNMPRCIYHATFYTTCHVVCSCHVAY